MNITMSELVELFRKTQSNYSVLSARYGDPIRQEDEGYEFILTRTHATLKTLDGSARVIVNEKDVELVYETPEDLTATDLGKMKEMLMAYAEIKFKRYVLKKA